MSGFWDRRVKVEGSYIFESGENMNEFYKAIGKSDMVNHIKDFKLHTHMHGNHIRMSEYIGELGRFSNSMDLDVEVPFVIHGDTNGNLDVTSKLSLLLLDCYLFCTSEEPNQ